MTWTLEGELNELARCDEIICSLQTLRLVAPNSSSAVVEIIQDWFPSGAETYSLHFAVTASSRRCEYLMKACVAYDGGTQLSKIFAEWLSRRVVVETLGVSTPSLHGVGSALLVEEYIRYSLSDAISIAADREGLLRAIGSTAARLINVGFAPVSSHDWRSRGNDVVLVDFGQDLGPPHLSSGGSGSDFLSGVLDNLIGDGVDLQSKDLQFVVRSYESFLLC